MNVSKTLTGFQVKAGDEGTVKAVVATTNVVDADGDVIRPGAFGAGQNVLISSYGHGSWKGAPPVGRGRIFEAGREAIFEGRFWLSTDAGRETWTVVKEASDLQEWSFSLEDVQAERGEFDGRAVRFIHSVKVKEVSPVLRGAGVNTRTLAMKSQLADVRRIRDEFMAARAAERARGRAALAEAKRTLDRLDHDLKVRRAIEDTNDVFGDNMWLTTSVPARTRRAGEVAAEVAAHDLSVDVPDVRWFHGAKRLYGRANRSIGTIFLAARQTPREAAATAAHEVAHIAGMGHPDAYHYEAEFVRRAKDGTWGSR